MFKLIAVFSAVLAVASAGYIGGYGLSGPAYTSYHAPAVVHAAPIYKSLAVHTAPAVVHAPIVHAPVATSYANTYKVSAKSIPVVHAAPALVAAPIIKSYAAPAVYASAPAYYGHGLGHGLASYGHSSYGHSVYH